MNLGVANYFDGKISHGFVSLFTSKSIIRIAGGLFGVFLPIFLYEYFGENFQYTMLWYLFASLFYVITVATGAKFMNSFGFRKGLRLGSFLGAVFFAVLYFAGSIDVWLFVVLSLFTLTIHRIFHWIPYHVDFAKFTDKQNRGREVGLLEATTNVIGVITPFVAGFVITRFSFDALFLIAILIYFISLIPLITIPRTHEKFSWKYGEAWKQLFSKKRRETVFAYLADGAESGVGLIIWPIFIFEVLEGNYLEIGFISALIIGATIILQLTVGKYTDKKMSKEKLVKFGSLFYSIGWVIKVFIVTAFQIFIIDAYHKLMKIVLRIPFDALTYEIAADEGHLVDEYTVIHEMAIHIGRIISLAIAMLLALYLGINWTFALAAISSLLLNFLRAKKILYAKK